MKYCAIPKKVYFDEKPSLDDIYHHGILGMKWGKKNGPPYPLDATDHSASEKKAGYKKSIGGGTNENLYERDKNRHDKYNPTKASVKKGEKTSSKSNIKIYKEGEYDKDLTSKVNSGELGRQGNKVSYKIASDPKYYEEYAKKMEKYYDELGGQDPDKVKFKDRKESERKMVEAGQRAWSEVFRKAGKQEGMTDAEIEKWLEIYLRKTK